MVRKTNPYVWDWADLAYASKKPIRQLNATFVAAPRQISGDRLKQLFKLYLPEGPLVLGLAKEEYIDGLEGQAAFKTLSKATAQNLIDRINAAGMAQKIYVITYSQRELPFLIDKLGFKRALFINGSWYHAFHLRPEYYALTKLALPYDLISPFASEIEAKTYAADHQPPAPELPVQPIDDRQMMDLAAQAAKQSFAYSEHQTGVALGHPKNGKYIALATAFNRVVPYQTHAMHFGASREINFSPPNDLNHYDTNHAEMELLLAALREPINLAGTTLFINLMPCPTCARALCRTDIGEIVYEQDHSDGYAAKLFKATGKQIRRLI